jgi:hypothetical protein
MRCFAHPTGSASSSIWSRQVRTRALPRSAKTSTKHRMRPKPTSNVFAKTLNPQQISLRPSENVRLGSKADITAAVEKVR